MDKMKEMIAVKAFRAKLVMARLNVSTKRGQPSQAHKPDSSGHFAGEFDITFLPLPVKKHIITAGIIQGDIFQHGDGFSRIKEVLPSQAKSTSTKTLYLQIRALNPKSYEMAIGVIEILIDEILEPLKRTQKRLTCPRSWAVVVKKEYEIQRLKKPVISHLITKGIIKGDLYQSSGAVVNARGNPYLGIDSPPEPISERPFHLLIQGPNDNNLYWAVDRIQQLIKEAEEILNNDTSEVIYVGTIQPSSDPVPCELEPESNVITPVADVHVHPRQGVQYPPFMPRLGQTVEADVIRCAVLVHWLLAHPLFVSFMACPPNGCESKRISKKMATTALLCLPLYDQYECTHLMQNRICNNCHKFFSEAQKAVGQCCEAVATSGYDISKLITVDDYIKELAVNPEAIGVLYDYPLPLNLFYIHNCRLFIDLAINCGLYIDESHIESYLKSTKEWYPVKAFQKVVVASQVKPCPSKNPITHQYPLYFTLDHHGGLINFHLATIGNASPGRYFPPDAPKIPKCSYFPFLHRLSAFSKLYNYNTKYINVREEQNNDLSGSISLAAYQMTRESLKNSEPNRSSPHRSLRERATEYTKPPARIMRLSLAPPQTPETSTSTAEPSLNNPFWNNQVLLGNPEDPYGDARSEDLHAPNSQNRRTGSKSRWTNKEPTQETQKLKGSLPPSFSVMQEPHEKPTRSPNPNSSSNQSRILRKQIRRENLEKAREQKKEEKREEINQTIETLKEKHGANSFWTIDTSQLEAGSAKEKLENLLVGETSSYNLNFGSTPPPAPAMPLLTGSTFSQNLQQVLGNMQLSMPATQSTMFGAPPPMTMRPALITTEPEQDDSQLPQGGSQSNAFSEVISKLQEFIQEADTETIIEVESDEDEEIIAEPQQSSDPVQEVTPSVHQSAASGGSGEDSAFSAIIQQLQQFIDSSSQATTSQDPPADQFKKPLDPIARTKARETQQTSKVECKQESSELKRASTELTSEPTQPKRLCTDYSKTPAPQPTKPTPPATTFTHQKPDHPAQKPGYGKDVSASQYPSSSIQKNIGMHSKISFTHQKPDTPAQKQGYGKDVSASQNPSSSVKKNIGMHSKISFTHEKPDPPAQTPVYGKDVSASQNPSSPVQKNIGNQAKLMSMVSILGDSLLQRARSQWGGSDDQDIRADSFNIADLRSNVLSFLNQGGQLRHYCVVMCGANNVTRLTTGKGYVTDLKIMLNQLLNRGYYVFLVTLPLVVSIFSDINKYIPTINGLILSFHTKANLSIIPFHKIFQEDPEYKNNLLKSVHMQGNLSVVLSDLGCKLIREAIEKEVRGLKYT